MLELLRRNLITTAQATRGTNRLPGTIAYDPSIAPTEEPLHFDAATNINAATDTDVATDTDADRPASVGPAARIVS